MPNVFISYRREDASGYAQAVYGQLERFLRRDQIFMDVDTIPPGVDFVSNIEQAVAECDVLIALIGKRWMGERENGPPRIHDPEDFVHLEIAAALARDIRVIPVLVDGASMPSKDQLPRTLQPLVRRNALELSNTRFRYDLDRVSEAVRKTIVPARVTIKADKQWPRKMWPGGLPTLLIVLGIVVGLWFKWGEDKQTEKASLSPRKVFRDRLRIGGEGPEMVVISAGTFQMGDLQGSGNKDAKPVHFVRNQKPIAVGLYEVTFEDYDRFAKATGRKLSDDNGWGRGRRPVVKISWKDATDYSEWLSEQTGKRYRLPTEAEWEYAARAGTQTEYWWGNDLIKGMANCDGCGSQWDNTQTASVGSFKPNKFGLYETAGNVWEWVQDCWHENYTGAPIDGSAWLEASGGNCGQRVMRGGSWYSEPVYLRSSYRGGSTADYRGTNIGFRLARDLE
jgi:formylglycine-generating enzyme required for sulfatase activity